MLIRKANLNDTKNIYLLYKNVINSDPGHLTQYEDEIYLKYIKYELQKSLDLGLTLVLEDGSNIIGIIKAYTSEYIALAHILTNTTVMIRSDYQRKNYGTLLMSEYLKTVENEMKFIYKLELLPHISNSKAISFYERNGFVSESISNNKIFNRETNSFENEIHLSWLNKNFNFEELSKYHKYLLNYQNKKYN